MCGSDIFLQDGSREILAKERILAKGKKLYAAFMDLEKAYDRVDWLALWDGLKTYGVGGKLLSAKSFYEKAPARVKISGETSEHFEIKVGLRQGCVMSPWLFNIYMDGDITHPCLTPTSTAKTLTELPSHPHTCICLSIKRLYPL